MTLFLLLIVPTIILGMWAQSRVQGSYSKWSRVGNHRGISGRDAARIVLERAGIHDVQIVSIQGHLTDHYDPSNKRLALSEENYHGRSLAAVGIAAHEAGHAIQHAVGYSMLKLRMSLVPITTFASQLLPFVMIGGFFFGMTGLINLGVIVYLVLTIFQLVTLPVEFDASNRAKAELVNGGVLYDEEMNGVRDMLGSAAWTYVAAFVSSLANLLYLFLLSRRE
ncbi:MAG: zinc metallopeptidase [Verrucomicrobiota bacterium JB022]|nr:zinc metallopeptidase [Verrucomicrobiota bacterium JB022]